MLPIFVVWERCKLAPSQAKPSFPLKENLVKFTLKAECKTTESRGSCHQSLEINSNCDSLVNYRYVSRQGSDNEQRLIMAFETPRI